MKRRILLAEDNNDLAYILSIALGLLGYEVVVATDGVATLELALSLHPDLIIMPKMDGFQAVPHLRQNPETKNIPILAVTALALRDDREKCLAAGYDDYISKPCTPQDLAAAIEGLLWGSSRQDQKQSIHGQPG